MKIAIFSDTFPPQVDGVANVVYRSASTLGRLGHDVYVFTVSNGLWGRRNNARNVCYEGFTLIRLPAVPAFVYPGYHCAVPVGIAFKALKAIRPDIIHTHTPFTAGWEAVFLARLFNIPLIGTHHTFFNHYLKHVKLDYRWTENITWQYTIGYYNHCDIILSPSRSLADELEKHGLKKPIMTHPNPINREFFRPVADPASKKKLQEALGIEGNGKLLVYMGRVSYEKSIDQVVKAMALVVKTNPDVNLLIVGDGPERNNLEKLTDDLGLNNNVKFLGFLYNQTLLETLQASDILLTASKTENMPLSVLESMAVGLPVIAAAALGIPELVQNNVNGYLVKPDDFEGMAKKTLELVGNDELLERFSSASRNLSANYSQEIITASLERIYSELIKENENLCLS